MAVIYDEQSHSWYSTLLEKHYDSQEAARHYEVREVQSRGRRIPEQEEADKLKPEVIRALYYNEMISQARKEASIACKQDADAFFVMHPEYVDSVANARQMGHYFMSRGIESPSLEQMEAAYESLRDAGLLEFNRAELVKLGKQRVRQRVDQIVKQRESEPTEEELYKMPLKDLAARANGIAR
jgi:hypothetical protein